MLDGRHRVRAFEKLGWNKIEAIKEDMKKDEALKFVRDTAIERRNLTDQQKTPIVPDIKGVNVLISKRCNSETQFTKKVK